jgi:hypothetical protein
MTTSKGVMIEADCTSPVNGILFVKYDNLGNVICLALPVVFAGLEVKCHNVTHHIELGIKSQNKLLRNCTK